MWGSTKENSNARSVKEFVKEYTTVVVRMSAQNFIIHPFILSVCKGSVVEGFNVHVVSRKKWIRERQEQERLLKLITEHTRRWKPRR